MTERFSNSAISALRESSKLARSLGSKSGRGIKASEMTSLNDSIRDDSDSERSDSQVCVSGPQIKEPKKKKKRKSKAKKFSSWLRRTFCGETTVHTNTDLREMLKSDMPGGSELTPDSWRDQLKEGDFFGRQFDMAQTEVPQYVILAQQEIKKLARDKRFQQQAKRDQQEFKLAMQNILA